MRLPPHSNLTSKAHTDLPVLSPASLERASSHGLSGEHRGTARALSDARRAGLRCRSLTKNPRSGLKFVLREPRREAREQISGQRMLEPPRHGHGHLAFVAEVVRWPKKVERAIRRPQPREGHDARALGRVVLVAAAGVAGGAGD